VSADNGLGKEDVEKLIEKRIVSKDPEYPKEISEELQELLKCLLMKDPN